MLIAEVAMFLNRSTELKKLREAIEKTERGNTGVLIYGRRRVGKSTIVRKALEEFDGLTIEYECLEALFQTNLKALASCVAETLSMPALAYINDINVLLNEMNNTNKKIALFIDEYQFIRSSYKEGNIDSVFQNLLDKKTGHVLLILCGSYISAMTELLKETNPLYGRFKAVLFVRPFDYLDSSSFYPDLTPREKIAYYAVFGGMPFVLEEINTRKTLEENISDIILDPFSGVRFTIEETLLKEIAKIDLSQSILNSLGNGKKKICNIASDLNVSDQLASQTVHRLITMGLLRKTCPINDPDNAKKNFIEISDNLLRFYYCAIFKHKREIERMGKAAFFNNRIAASLNTFIASRFENVVDEFIRCSLQSNPSLNIIDYGRYWYDLPKEKRNGEFDNVIKTSEGYIVIESKYLSAKMKAFAMREEAEKILAIKELKIKDIGFASASGFEESPDGYLLITGEDLYDKAKMEKGGALALFTGIATNSL